MIQIIDPVFKSDAVVNCNSISLYDVSDGQVVANGRDIATPGCLHVEFDAGIALASQATRFLTFNSSPVAVGVPIVYALWSNAAKTSWSSGYMYSSRYGVATAGDVAILPGATHFLLSTVRYRESWDTSLYLLPNDPPFHVRKLPMPPMQLRPMLLGIATASFETQGVAAQIVLAKDGTIAHIVTDRAVVHSVRIDTMTEVAPAVSIPPVMGLLTPVLNTTIAYIWADLSLDENYLITNQGKTGEITIVDLRARTARSVALDPTPRQTGGVAINHGWVNRGMLAVHERDHISTYAFDPLAPGPLPALASARVVPIPPVTHGAIYDAIAWNAAGDKVLPTTFLQGGIAVFGVGRQGELTQLRDVQGCGRLPADIWTANGVFEPSPTPTSTPTETATTTITPTASATGTATHTPAPTRTPPPTLTASPTLTPSPTSTATRVPLAIYLPVSLRERCSPEREPVDVVLVVDASTSMDERTSAGVRKLDAATRAAGTFVGLLKLDAGDRAAVVSFNAQARVEQPLTANRAALTASLDRLTTAPQTCLPCAVDVGATELEAHGRAGALEVLIVLTDGRSNPRPVSEAVDRAKVAKDAGVMVFTIALGSDVDAAALQAMASYPGAYLAVADAGALEAAYATIARTLPCPPGAFWGGR